jgi:hypothetical protein
MSFDVEKRTLRLVSKKEGKSELQGVSRGEDIPKRNILPPPVGVATTACAERGPGHVGETNFRHSS